MLWERFYSIITFFSKPYLVLFKSHNPIAHRRGYLHLLLVYVAIICTLILRIQASTDHYTSPDSHYYLHAAEMLFSEEQPPAHYQKLRGVWPMGYPFLISITQETIDVSFLWASKVVNFIFLGLTLLLLYAWYGPSAWFVALYFFSFGKLEVYSYTWSEGPFLFFALFLMYLLQKSLLVAHKDRLLFLKLFLTLTALFLLRYAGILYILLVIGACIWLFKDKDQRHQVYHYLTALVLTSIVVVSYLLYNQLTTGHFTGMPRVTEVEPLLSFTGTLLKGLANEVLLARNYFSLEDIPIFLFFAALQIIILGYIFLQYMKNRESISFSFTPDEYLLIFSGVFYLIGIISLRIMHAFDPFDYRILAPYSTPVWIALFGAFARSILSQRQKNGWLAKFAIGFMIVSLLINLPIHFLGNKLF